MEIEKLIREAFQARRMAYTPYSHFQVGAALLEHLSNVHFIDYSHVGTLICCYRGDNASGLVDVEDDVAVIQIAAALVLAALAFSVRLNEDIVDVLVRSVIDGLTILYSKCLAVGRQCAFNPSWEDIASQWATHINLVVGCKH